MPEPIARIERNSDVARGVFRFSRCARREKFSSRFASVAVRATGTA